MKGLQLLATGGALPGRVVTNEDLSRQVDTSDEWITTRTGICQRYYCTENEDAATLAVTAAELAALAVSVYMFVTKDQKFHYRYG
jgi:3-oxoacyl-[acyl-carrier-protein] synthase-3